MPFGYTGQNLPNQTVANSGVFSISEVADLEKQGKFGGSLELIQEQTASGDSALNFTNIKENKYDVHFVTYENINNFSSSGSNFALRFYENGTLETASVYQYAAVEQKADGNNYTPKSTGATYLFLSMASLAPGEVTSGYVYIYDAGNSAKQTFINVHDTTLDNSVFAFNYGGGLLPQSSVVDGFSFLEPSGHTFNGTVKLYGVKQL